MSNIPRRPLPQITARDHVRLWSRLARDHQTGCLLWTGAVNNRGYGFAGLGGKNGSNYLVHRLAFVAAGGRLTEACPDVLHSCDNRRCCEPTHLRAGNDRENAREMSQKCRGRRGSLGLPHGVRLAPSGRYQSRARPHCGRERHLGTFDTWQEAAAIAALHRNGGGADCDLRFDFCLPRWDVAYYKLPVPRVG